MMKGSQIVARYLKARAVSWLTSGPYAVVLPTLEGHPAMFAMFVNGRYVTPEVVNIPNDPRDLWGPDGPIGPEQPPAAEDETPEENPDESS
jgi:hypothetical protein